MGKNKHKILYKISVFILALFFVFLPISPLKIISRADNYSSGDVISQNQVWNTDTLVDGFVTIEIGATLTVKEGVKVTFKNNGKLNVEGKLYVRGTQENPVKFRQDGFEEAVENEGEGYSGYVISVSGEAYFKNADIAGGGSLAYESMNENRNLFNTAYAAYVNGAVNVGSNGKLRMDECNVHGNMVGIYLNKAKGENIKVIKTLFNNNSLDDADNISPQSSTLPDFEYDWWRDGNGPEETGNEYAPYKYINGQIDFSNYLKSENFKDPVIIIPGILGSEKVDGKLEIDPVFHVYDNLIEEFKSNGYSADKDLFTFPYEWRDSNVDNAKLMEDKINEIKNQANWPEVDIVAHSMGGLLAREYVESDYYQDDVDQLITLGTPNEGAPSAYPKWEAGAFTFDLSEIYLSHKFSQEAKENGYDNIFHYIHQRPILSVKELLPTYSYLYEAENNNQLREYPNNYPINDFLENLNADSNQEKLMNVEMDKIVGNVKDDASTISGFKVVNSNMGEYWVNGYPLGFEIPVGDRGMIFNQGDRTVPLDSARSENIFSDKIIEINSDHTSLPTNAQKEAIEILTGTKPSSEVTHGMIRDMLMTFVFSPVDIQIVDPNGKRVGKDFESGKTINEIDGAYYSGADAENEFLTIPNPMDGDYKILTQGTGSGDYKIETTEVSAPQDDSQNAVESTATIEGTTNQGEEGKNKITLNNNEVTLVSDNSEPPIVNPPEPPADSNPSANNSSSTSSSKSDKGGGSSHHKKKSHKKHKAKKKSQKAKTPLAQVQKVLGTYTNKCKNNNSLACRSWNYVAQTNSATWGAICKVPSKIGGFLSWLLNFFKVRR